MLNVSIRTSDLVLFNAFTALYANTKDFPEPATPFILTFLFSKLSIKLFCFLSKLIHAPSPSKCIAGFIKLKISSYISVSKRLYFLSSPHLLISFTILESYPHTFIYLLNFINLLNGI